MKGAAERTAAARSHERFRIQVTSNFLERQTRSRRRGTPRPQLSFFFFREEVFSSRRPAEWPAPNAFGGATGLGPERWGRGKNSGSWFLGEVESLWLRVESRGKPPSTSLRSQLETPNWPRPLSRLHPRNRFG